MTAALPLDERRLRAIVQAGIVTCHCTLIATDPECSGCAADVALARLAGVSEAREELRDALNDPALLHWLGSQDVLDVSAAVARAVSAIHRLRNVLAASPSEAQAHD